MVAGIGNQQGPVGRCGDPRRSREPRLVGRPIGETGLARGPGQGADRTLSRDKPDTMVAAVRDADRAVARDGDRGGTVEQRRGARAVAVAGSGAPRDRAHRSRG